ncbi:BTB/POZ domain-containing protein At4g08455 [Gastrolobium bilobum]|uniref:BTB/POZ domain-containing protein At4g08455 n=1 Tax=Gastrolobium bilobum TaxID=150636 RepID=UPI002AB01027|nr:BTB/POZ domain-containing protein At4g08455 [Gastrolobium bilobum]
MSRRWRCTTSALARRYSDTDYDEEENITRRCLSCEDDYDPENAGTCKVCYEEANETEDELKREIQELKSNVSFLKLSSPIYSSTNSSTTDVTLIPSDYPSSACVPAHKAVLVSRSPVFKAMLENDMEESRSGTIKISDVSYDVLYAFVNFLYTAEACLDNQMARDLLVLAEKYEVMHLKANCEKYLMADMNWEKAIENYAFAHLHNVEQLLDVALARITDNMHILTINEDYKELVETNPRLLVQIFEAYLAKQDNIADPLKL